MTKLDIAFVLTLAALVPGALMFLIFGLFTNIPPLPMAVIGGSFGFLGGVGTLYVLRREIVAVRGFE